MTIEKLVKHEFFRTQNLEFAFDYLTKLLKKDIFLSYAEYLVKQGYSFEFCLIDLDDFKKINDTYGHLVGDRVLEAFSKHLNEFLPEDAVIARYGGNQFMYIVENVNEYDDVWKIAHDLNTAMRKDVEYPIKEQVTFSCGISRHPIDGVKFEELYEKSDKALTRGKIKGGNCFIIYLPEKHSKIEVNKSRLVEKGFVEINQKITNIIFKQKYDTKTAIERALKYTLDSLKVDHVGVDGKSQMYFSVIDKLSPTKNFKHMEIGHINLAIGNTGLLYLSQRNVVKAVSESFFYDLVEQNISSEIIAKINICDKHYGYLRCEMTSARTWLLQEIDVIANLAKNIALKLYFDEQLNK